MTTTQPTTFELKTTFHKLNFFKMTDEIITKTEAKIFLKINKGKFDYLVASKKIYSKNIKGELFFLKSDLMKFSNRKKTENFQIFESSLNFN